MEQRALGSPSPARSGKTATASKTIPSTVCSSLSRLANEGECCATLFVGWTGDSEDRTIVAFSPLPTTRLRLPAGDINTSLLHLSAVIRDKMDCVTRVNLTVVVETDSDEINRFLLSLQAPANNPLVQILSSGNQNAVGQVISSLSQHFNRINTQALQDAADRSFLSHRCMTCSCTWL